MDDPLAPGPAPIALDVAPEPTLPALFAASIGIVGAGRYLPLFAQWEADGKSRPSWNWAAGLCTFNWMIFRQLWLPAALYAAVLLVLPPLVVGVGRLLLQWSDATELAALLGCTALAFALPALLGDRLLYQHCRADIAHALERAPTLQAACSVLAKSAPSRIWLQRQVAINALGLGVLAAVGHGMWPTPPAADDSDRAPIPIQPAFKPVPAASVQPNAAAVVTSAVAPASAPVAPVIAMAASAPTPALAAASLPAAGPVASTAMATQNPTGFLINVGLFADPDNARRAYVKLVKAGLPAQREVLLFKGQRVTRVRAGPFESRAKANTAVQRIRKMQLDAVLAKP